MQSSTTNPITDRLTRGSKGPSARAATWIGMGVGALAMTLAVGGLLATVFDERYIAIEAVVLFAVVTLALICTLASFTWTALLTAHYALDQDFALVRISQLDAEDIVEGCVRGARYRLRLLWAVAFWILPAGWMCVALLSDYIDVIPVGYHWRYLYVVSVLSQPGLIVTTVAMLIFCLSWWMAVNLGVWIGLRWPHAARAVAGVVGVAGAIALCLGLAYAVEKTAYGARWFDITILRKRVVAIGVPAFLLFAGQLIYNDAIINFEPRASGE